MGDGVGVGEGVGEGEGVGVGAGVGVTPGASVGVGADTLGRTASWAVALEVTSTVWLPRIGVRNGVSRGTEPVTRTVTELPSASTHGEGLQTIVMFEAVIVVDAPADSVRTAHTTRFVSAWQGAPAW